MTDLIVIGSNLEVGTFGVIFTQLEKQTFVRKKGLRHKIDH